MSPRYALYSLCALVAALALAWGIGDWQQGRGSQAEHNAAVAQGEANAHQSQAQAHDSEVANLQARLQAREADLGRLHAERDALLRKLAAKPKPGADPVGDDLSPIEPVGADDSEIELLRATVAKDAEVIEALEADSVVKDSLITEALRSRDEWKATAEARERQALAQEAATKAWKDAVVASKWRGRAEGFAVGLASGYVAGRLK